MGTNFYARFKICNECNRYDELHIGKSSAGWKFGVEIHEEYYKTFDELCRFLDTVLVKIFDEYDREIEFKTLLSLIKNKKDQKSHFDNYPNDKYADDEFVDLQKGEFS